jgi:proteic killer suppression protein
MQIEFKDKDLIDLLTRSRPPKGIPPEVLRHYQKAIVIIKAARDQRDIRAQKSFHLEKMTGFKDDRYSIRLSKSWRVFLLFESRGNDTIVVILDMNNHYGD